MAESRSAMAVGKNDNEDLRKSLSRRELHAPSAAWH